jgi:hypothetical protein
MSAVANGETENAAELLDSDAFMRQFLDILKDASSSSMNVSTVRSLALQIFAHPQIFCGFDEFKSRCLPLLLPQGENSSHSGSPSSSLFNTIDLFSFGTLKDYTSHQQEQTDDEEYYLPLNEPALAKLSQLSVLTCIQQACFNGETSILYDALVEVLGSSTSSTAVMEEDGASSSPTTSMMANTRDIEDVLIRCLYANVLKGKLCQKTRSFSWRGERLPVVLSRDVSPDQISDLLSALEGLGQRLGESGKDVAEAQEQVTQGLDETAQYWMSVQSQKKMSLEETHTKGTGGGTGGSSSGGGTSSSRFYGGGSQDPGSFPGQGRTTGSSGAQGLNNPRRSSKRSRGGMAGNFLSDTAGFRM